MTIRAKVVTDHKEAVKNSKEAGKAETDSLAAREAAVQKVKSLTQDGTVSFAVLDDAAKAELVDALVMLSGGLR